MCFSASASFTASAFLIPTGIYCLTEAKKKDESYLALASIPFWFGIQQGFEGFVWLNILSHNDVAVINFSWCFLFFSHFFWLFWIPLSAFMVENDLAIKNKLKGLSIVGFVYGGLLYFPLLINNNWLQVEAVNHSINYVTDFFFSRVTPQNFSFYLYAIIIITPLMLSSQKTLNYLGCLFVIGALIAYFYFYYAFASVWCFIAAILSIYLVGMIRNLNPIDSSLISNE